VRNRKTNASEPLMTHRKAIQLTSKPSSVVGSGQVQTQPAYGLDGVRSGGGVILYQDLVGNVGTCRFNAKGEIRRSSPPKEKSTNVRHRGGAARSGEETAERLWSKGLRHPVGSISQPARGGACEFGKSFYHTKGTYLGSLP
jgi:hypothetical protein